MEVDRLRVCAAMAIAVVCLAPPAEAQRPQRSAEQSLAGFPSKPVRIIVGSAPGGGADLTARVAAQKLTEMWSRSVIVENRSGTALYALEATARATPDGYTMGMGTFNAYLLAVISTHLRFDLTKDLEPVTQMTSQPYLLVVHPSVPATTLKDLIAYAKARPGKLNYASSGTGGAGHLGMELLKSMTGIDMVHVPYRGIGPGVIDLLAGQVHMLFGSAPSVAPHVHSGRLKAIAVTTGQRARHFPDLPTIAESGVPGFELNGWYGLVAPARVAPPVLALLHRSVAQSLSQPDVHARFAADGSEVAVSTSPQAFKTMVERETAKWARFVKASGFSASM
jgi:tripartite-type tricarboxylate transporter receptor subunit TctC